MATATSKLEILISAKDQASDKIDNVTGSLGNLGGKVLKGAAIGLGVATAAMGAAGLGAIKLARDAAPIQGVQDAFYGLADAAGYSAGEMLKSLQSSSAGMITNADLMTGFNKAAGLVSQDFAEKLPDAMGLLGKVAAATGEDMGFMMDSLITGVGRLSPMILDNLQIQVSLSEATDKAAEMFGKEASELTKAEQQAGMMEVTLAKLAENTKDMPDVVGSAEQKFAAFSTTIQNTKDAIGLALLPIITPLMDKLSELAQKYLPPLMDFITGSLIPGLQNFALYIGEVVSSGDPLNAMLDNLPERFRPVAEKIGEVITKFIEIKDAISEFVNGTLIPFVQEHWESLKGALIAVGALLAGAAIISGITAIAGALAVIISPIGLIIAAVALLGVAWANNWGGIQEKTQAVVEWLQDFITTAFTALQEFWAVHGETIIATVTQLWEGIQSVIDSVVTIVTITINAALQFIDEIWTKHGAQITALVSTLWNTIVTVIQSVIKIIVNVFKAFVALFKGDWEGLKTALLNIWDALWAAVQAIFETAKATLSTAFEILKTVLTNIFDRAKIALLGVWEKAWDAITSYLETAKKNVIDKINELIDKVKAAFDIDWKTLGQNIIDGIKKGITDAAKGLAQAAVAAARKAWQAVKDFLQSKSPSRLFADLGMNTMIGFANGIRDTAGVAEYEAVSAAKAVATGFRDTITSQMDNAGGEATSIWNWHMQDMVQGTGSAMDQMVETVTKGAKDLGVTLDESLASINKYWQNAGSIFGGENPIGWQPPVGTLPPNEPKGWLDPDGNYHEVGDPPIGWVPYTSTDGSTFYAPPDWKRPSQPYNSEDDWPTTAAAAPAVNITINTSTPPEQEILALPQLLAWAQG